MTRSRLALSISVALMLFSLGGASAQGGAQSCQRQIKQSCSKTFRVCLASCAPNAGFGQDECRYRCCVDKRVCLIAGNCDARPCRD
ncbi:hypothetical protein [Methylocystis parvus]|uniref:Uncharacterized protein n=1 Tax=Methylocystis parvus TaxID=134 RepID=A0A6B8M7Z6_9HYPH|nr:hypothetical protein [Methylocystis parvus]QGM98686.1 hypothetical protein F7D14_15165 [Methylocystis parvus]WBK00966.1 hypothetical protein MMG94_04400 [Methylocystis parvus OBBP]